MYQIVIKKKPKIGYYTYQHMHMYCCVLDRMDTQLVQDFLCSLHIYQAKKEECDVSSN